jgi:hypothetical protein
MIKSDLKENDLHVMLEDFENMTRHRNRRQLITVILRFS